MARRLGLVLALLLSVTALGPACHNNATTPTLTATCGATPATGNAPLSVAFTLNVAGAEGSFSTAVDYGDGTQGSQADKPHVYGSAGSYAPSFTITTATQSARCSTSVTVLAGPAPTPTPPATNQPPMAVFKTDPVAHLGTITGTAPLEVHFNMCPTEDPEHDALEFKMDLDGDGVFEVVGSTGADCRRAVTYAAGTHQATDCVTDVDCNSWPACAGTATLHRFQCRSYTIVVSP